MVGSNEKDRVRAEAAAWVAKLDGNSSGEAQTRFLRWIEADPAHRLAYDRALQNYRKSALIRQSPVGRDVSLESEFPRQSTFMRGAIAAGMAGLLVIGAYQLTGSGLFGPPLQAVLLSSGASARQVTLEDGSSLTLAPASEVQVELGRRERRAELRRGRARVAVAREDRPFLLKVGARQQTVNGGNYMMALDGGEAGAIQPMATVTGGAELKDDQRLVPREAVPASASSQRLEFDATPLADVAALANRSGDQPRLTIDPRVAGRRVTGLFRSGDSEALARSLAVALNLRLVTTSEGLLRLEPHPK